MSTPSGPIDSTGKISPNSGLSPDPVTPSTWPNDLANGPPASVLYFHEECLVVNKPAGLLTQAPPGIPSLEAQARRFWQATTDYVGVPHRLDRATSGALLLGQSKVVTRKLAAQFERRTIRKVYWALLEGSPPDPAGTWCDWMCKRPDQSLSEITTADDPAAQSAELDYRVLGTSPTCAWVEILLKTGRTHQIRLQASARGMPIVGDADYGATAPFGPPQADQRQRPIALHARTLDFWHPRLHHPVVVSAPVPPDWLTFADNFAPDLKASLMAADMVK